jgi:subfamily B ATP-binding cassette protein MsbA
VLQNAAEQASVLEFAKNLTHGLETEVGPQGRALSGGQRQRIALARAMVRDPELLILDEPTAAVDALSEQLVQRALREFVKGRTTFLITHQLSAAWLEMISRIVVLDQGRVVAIGRHDELLKVCPIYQRLFAQGAVRHAA